ncbi:protein deadpan-like isoform X2 [Rhodnius prolixus]
MEKRRRARINNCLNELKSLILDALKKDPARHSKLEKADILEMTVKHVESLQRHQAALTAAADPTVINKFKAGWSECITEIGRFPGLEAAVRRRLMDHLNFCIEDNRRTTASTSPPPATIVPVVPAVQQQQQQQQPSPTMVVSPATTAAGPSPSPPALATLTTTIATNLQSNQTTQAQFLHRRETGVLALVPTRLSNGDIALVLPSPPPLVPASSQQPLCLAISKQDVEKPWRPW